MSRLPQIIDQVDSGYFHFVEAEFSKELQEYADSKPHDFTILSVDLDIMRTEEEICQEISARLVKREYSTWGPVIDSIFELPERASGFVLLVRGSNLHLERSIIEMLSHCLKPWVVQNKPFHVIFLDSDGLHDRRQ